MFIMFICSTIQSAKVLVKNIRSKNPVKGKNYVHRHQIFPLHISQRICPDDWTVDIMAQYHRESLQQSGIHYPPTVVVQMLHKTGIFCELDVSFDRPDKISLNSVSCLGFAPKSSHCSVKIFQCTDVLDPFDRHSSYT